jgi:hypothetical protein
MGSEKGCGVFFDVYSVDLDDRMRGLSSGGGGGDGEARENRRKRGLSLHLLHPLEIGYRGLMIEMEANS